MDYIAVHFPILVLPISERGKILTEIGFHKMHFSDHLKLRPFEVLVASHQMKIPTCR